MMEKSLIVAVADNNAIGRKNALLWNLPGDMKYFRKQTTGNVVIMGWMTFQSIGRPLPKRHNIVISLFPWPEAPAEVTVVDSLAAAFAAAERASQDEKAFVIGGAYTYAEAMDVVDTMYITHVHDAPEDADAFFPPIDPEIWEEESRSDLQTDPETGITFEFVVYRRRTGNE
jgi:dihydrofolate reductase